MSDPSARSELVTVRDFIRYEQRDDPRARAELQHALPRAVAREVGQKDRIERETELPRILDDLAATPHKVIEPLVLADLRAAYAERVAKAGLPAEESKMLAEALEAGLTGYTYLSDEPLS